MDRGSIVLVCFFDSHKLSSPILVKLKARHSIQIPVKRFNWYDDIWWTILLYGGNIMPATFRRKWWRGCAWLCNACFDGSFGFELSALQSFWHALRQRYSPKATVSSCTFCEYHFYFSVSTSDCRCHFWTKDQPSLPRRLCFNDSIVAFHLWNFPRTPNYDRKGSFCSTGDHGTRTNCR